MESSLEKEKEDSSEKGKVEKDKTEKETLSVEEGEADSKKKKGGNRVHGRKPPLHPFSKQSENPTETSPVQNLRSSKRLKTDSKPL
ncbi:hypothetical protein JCGZ_10976 [Jatropha curcas]|uniref:Uncharacterized protein n=1 Tax=Jatropha curcas TaxID=180498 RepID=A0A067LE23_JATCU|nr:hypothetical protein JCGZ_10976 [Jatropha curcas]